jgi:hypothetical protein
MFAYSMGSMSEIIKDLGKRKQVFNEKMSKIEDFMEDRLVDI